jgi:hypothetical protein
MNVEETYNPKKDIYLLTLLFILFLSIYTLFTPSNTSGGSNSESRMDLTFSLIKDFSLKIDSVAKYSIDKAMYRGHYYSDKAPGLSITSIPVVSVIYGISRALGISTDEYSHDRPTVFYILCVWIACISSNGVATAAAATALYAVARHLRATQSAALFGAVCFGLGTPAFGWSTLFFGHALAGALLFLAFAAIIVADAAVASPRRDRLLGSAVGFLLSWAFTVEFTAGAAAFVIAVFGLRRTIFLPANRRHEILAFAGLGGVIGLIPLAVYNSAAFGSPFHLGYASVVGFSGMRQGLFGIGMPHPKILYEIIFGRFRGILWLSPVLLAAPFAFVAAARHIRMDIVITATIVVVLFLLINSSYYYWDGGYSTGPRHIIPSLPFICIGLPFLWDDARRIGRFLLMALASVSIMLSLICSSTTMLAEDKYRDPVFDYIIPEWLHGHIHNAFAFVGINGWVSYLFIVVSCCGLLAMVRVLLFSRKV